MGRRAMPGQLPIHRILLKRGVQLAKMALLPLQDGGAEYHPDGQSEPKSRHLTLYQLRHDW